MSLAKIKSFAIVADGYGNQGRAFLDHNGGFGGSRCFEDVIDAFLNDSIDMDSASLSSKPSCPPPEARMRCLNSPTPVESYYRRGWVSQSRSGVGMAASRG